MATILVLQPRAGACTLGCPLPATQGVTPSTSSLISLASAGHVPCALTHKPGSTILPRARRGEGQKHPLNSSNDPHIQKSSLEPYFKLKSCNIGGRWNPRQKHPRSIYLNRNTALIFMWIFRLSYILFKLQCIIWSSLFFTDCCKHIFSAATSVRIQSWMPLKWDIIMTDPVVHGHICNRFQRCTLITDATVNIYA